MKPPLTNLSNREVTLDATALFKELEEPSDTPPPPRKPRSRLKEPAPWHPPLNPTQKLIFDDAAENVLGHGEKGSGKTIGFAHKIVRHAYENDNALVLIVAPSMRTGNEGIWYDLETLVLPQWRDGIGLEYTTAKLDPNTKDRHRWIRNRFGGWSKLLLMSIPYASQVESRIKGPGPSMVYVDELTNCEGVEYYSYPAAQLGRRRDIAGPQQFCASFNPKGPSHWVYELFFVEKVEDSDYHVYHVPIQENLHNLPKGYAERLKKIFASDPIEYKRLVLGEWIDRPTGDGLFKDYFIPTLHVHGDAKSGTGLTPIAGFPIIIGYDLGQVFNAITMLQLIPTKEGKNVWIVFDEVHHLHEKILYKRLAHEVIERLNFWRKLVGYDFQPIHITDESAVNQWRPGGEGSYDAWDFEKEYNKQSSKTERLLGCPKGQGSVQARIRLLQAKLHQEELHISAVCKDTQDMLMMLETEKDNPDKPKRSKYIHVFDSLTYPLFKMEMGYSRQYLKTGQTAPALIHCGRK